MAKKPTAETIKRRKNELKRHISKWRCDLLLQEWFIDAHMAMEDHETAAATIRVELEYLRASIMVYPCFWESNKKEREEYIVHELCHIITEEMYEMVHDQSNGRMVTPKHANCARERLTQRITNIAFEW